MENWKLKNLNTNLILKVSKPIINVGRQINTDISTRSTEISRNHAKFYLLADNSFVIEDQKSLNGTFVNGAPVTPGVPLILYHNDIVTFGGSEVKNENFMPYQVVSVEEELRRKQAMIPIPLKMSPKSEDGSSKTIKLCDSVYVLDSDSDEEEKATIKEEVLAQSEQPFEDCIIILDDDADEEDDNCVFSQIPAVEKKTGVRLSEDEFMRIKEEIGELDGDEPLNISTPIDVDEEIEEEDLLKALLSSEIEQEEEVFIEPGCSHDLPEPEDMQTDNKSDQVEPHDKTDIQDNTITTTERERDKKIPIIEAPRMLLSRRDSHKLKEESKKDKKHDAKKRENEKKKHEPTKRKLSESAEASSSKSKDSKKPRIKKMPSDYDKKTIDKEFNKRHSKNAHEKVRKDKELVSKRNKRLKELALKDHKDHKDGSVNRNQSESPKNFISSVPGPRIQRISHMNARKSTETEKPEKGDMSPENCATFAKPSASTSQWTGKVPDKPCERKQRDVKSPIRFPGLEVEDTRRQRTVDFDDIFRIIVKWHPRWFVEQAHLMTCPTVTPRPPVKMCRSFNSFQDYYNVLMPLHVLEIWQYAFEERQRSKESHRNKFGGQLIHQRYHDDLLSIDCQCYVSKDQHRNYPLIVYDLVFIVLVAIAKINGVPKKVQFTGVGLLKKSSFKELTDESIIDEQMAKQCRGMPQYKYVFTVVTSFQPNEGTELLPSINMEKVTNLKTHFRTIETMKLFKYSPLLEFILRPKDEAFEVTTDRECGEYSKKFLNKNQLEAVNLSVEVCLRSKPGLFLVVGPPGTGKSTVIISIINELIAAAKETGTKPCILLAAPSNAAIDQLLLKISNVFLHGKNKDIKMIRFGVESAIADSVRGYSLAHLSKKHVFNTAIKTDFKIKLIYDKLKSEINSLTKSVARWKVEADNDPKFVPQRNEETQKLKAKLSEINFENFWRDHVAATHFKRLKSVEYQLFEKCNIVCSTLTSCSNPKLEEFVKTNSLKLTCCIVDEATQATEADCLIPTKLNIEKIILVGDPKQLPATVLNKDAKRLDYGQSLLTRVFGSVEKKTVVLNEQYRMCSEICAFPSRKFYNGNLVTSKKVRPMLHMFRPYLVFSLNLRNYDTTQYTNDNEALFVDTLLRVIGSNAPKKQIEVGVITPYSKQRDAIKNNLERFPDRVSNNIRVTVNTVDSFQGQEKDIIIISTVRDSANSFIKDQNRLNVALTRAKSALYVVGDNRLFKDSPLYYDLKQDAERRSCAIEIKKQNFSEMDAYLKKQIFLTKK